jgi:hypothetical protein
MKYASMLKDGSDYLPIPSPAALLEIIDWNLN